MKLRSLSISSFSYATISSSGISPPEKMFARDTYWDNLDLRFSLSPSPVTSSTLPWQLSTTSKKFLDVFNIRYFHCKSPFKIFIFLCSTYCISCKILSFQMIFLSCVQYNLYFLKLQRFYLLNLYNYRCAKLVNFHNKNINK